MSPSTKVINLLLYQLQREDEKNNFIVLGICDKQFARFGGQNASKAIKNFDKSHFQHLKESKG